MYLPSLMLHWRYNWFKSDPLMSTIAAPMRAAPVLCAVLSASLLFDSSFVIAWCSACKDHERFSKNEDEHVP